VLCGPLVTETPHTGLQLAQDQRERTRYIKVTTHSLDVTFKISFHFNFPTTTPEKVHYLPHRRAQTSQTAPRL